MSILAMSNLANTKSPIYSEILHHFFTTTEDGYMQKVHSTYLNVGFVLFCGSRECYA